MSIAAKLRKLKGANYRETEILTLPDGTQVILSTLNGKEDQEIGDYLRTYLGKSLGHYSKLETLCYSIKWLVTPDGEEIDLRGVETIDTGEMIPATKEGEELTPIRKKRNVFMREIVHSWPDMIVDALFTRYGRMMEDLENSISKGIHVEMGDTALQAKIISLADELGPLVRQALQREVEVNDDLVRCFGQGTPANEGADALLQALQKRNAKIEEDTHPLDEQLARERQENPEVYPITPEESEKAAQLAAAAMAAKEAQSEEPQRVRR